MIRFWNQANGQQAGAARRPAGAVTALAFNPAGTQLLSASADGSVKLWAVPPVRAEAVGPSRCR